MTDSDKLYIEIELIKQSNQHVKDRLDQIHYILSGNGKPGLVQEMNEIRGALRFTQILFTIVLGIATLLVAIYR